MIARFVPAIVLLVLLIVCVILARLAFRRWKYPPKPRRRASDPAWLQHHRQFLANCKRMRRGLRFPTVEEKRRHLDWRKRFSADPLAVFQDYLTKLTQLREEANRAVA